MTMSNNGMAKLVEECGELLQVVGKVLAYGLGDHPDDNPKLLKQRLEEESADVLAAISFVMDTHDMSQDVVTSRSEVKYDRFTEWHNDKTT
jgi:NTP pyrophosphatase (non-canonical NTP hydrolase)